ncbi:MAG TPA: glycosyltransferase family 2 protein [Terriglobia bacterium]|nr:glycosyltransferase family 2 protein [Terriglobia bacterium]
MVKVSVVIPVYNERSTIEALLARVQAVDMNKEIIIVDDGSTDGTRDLLQQVAQSATRQPAGLSLPQTGAWLRTENIRVVFQPRNRGKGAALRAGFELAQGEVVIIQDADLEYDPGDYFDLLKPVESGVADVVYGSRFLGGPHRVLFFWHYVGNKFLTLLSNMLSNLNLTDVWTCYKVFRRPVLESLDLKEDRFGFEAEITAKLARGRWRVYEIPVSYYGRTYSEGKKITWRDGFRGIWSTLRYNLLS